MDNHISKIKNTTLWKNLSDNADNLIRYTISKEFKNTDEKIISNALKFLSQNYNIPEEYLDTKIFVSILLIAKHPDTFLDKNRAILEETVYNRANEIFNLIDTDNKDYKLLGKKMFSFKIVFDDWKEKDLKQQIDLLCEMYYRYQESIEQYSNDVAKSEYVQELKQFNTKIVNSMKALTPKYQTYLDNYSQKKIGYSDKINNLVYKKLKDIYWENIEKQIYENDNLTVIDQIITDYQDLLSNLANKNFNGDKFNVLRENYTVTNLKNLAIQIVRYNKQLDSENYDNIYEYTIEKINENHKNIISILKICFDRLEMIIKIKDEVKNKAQLKK